MGAPIRSSVLFEQLPCSKFADFSQFFATSIWHTFFRKFGLTVPTIGYDFWAQFSGGTFLAKNHNQNWVLLT